MSSAILRVWVLHVLDDHVGAVAPVLSGTITTSFVGRKCIFVGFRAP